MRKNGKNLWGVFLFVLLAGNLYGMDRQWAERYNFTTITMEEGLPHNYIDDLLKDSDGFLWIATNGNGVARYDSHEFICFNMQAKDGCRLRNNFVHNLCEDGFKRLWVASEQGIDLIDLQTLQLVDIGSKDTQWSRLRNLSFHLSYVSEAGNLWMASGNLLFKVVFDAEGNIRQIVEMCRLPKQESVRAVCEIDGYLWINYATGIYQLEESGLKPKRNPIKVLDLPGNGVKVNAFFPDDNEIWMGTTTGVFRYNRNIGHLRKYLDSDYVTDVIETCEHTILVSTLKGLGLYDSYTDSFERIDNTSYCLSFCRSLC